MLRVVSGLRFLVVAGAMLAVAACGIGRDFTPPVEGELRLGQTTVAEASQRFGQPYRRTVVASSTSDVNAATDAASDGRPAGLRPASVEGVTHVLGYVFVTSAASARSMLMTFWNDRLVFYNFVSSFAEQSTNFDESKVAQIRRNAMTYGELVALFGPPSGQGIYPVVAARGHRLIVYQFAQGNTQTRTVQYKRLEVLVDARDIVLDYYLRAVDQAVGTGDPAPQPLVVPVFIPTRR